MLRKNPPDGAEGLSRTGGGGIGFMLLKVVAVYG